MSILCKLGLHKKEYIVGRSSGVTYDVLERCKVCGKYILHSGFEGSSMGSFGSNVVNDTTYNLLKKVIPQCPKEKRKWIMQHLDNAHHKL